MNRSSQKNIRRKTQKGFTLMELLLVMAILVIMASMVTFSILKILGNAKRDLTQTQISTLKTACIKYKMSVGYFPNTLEDLVTSPSGINPNVWRGPHLDPPVVPMDQWGTPYNYVPDDNSEQVIITSAGPDRQAGTQDDVSNAPQVAQ